LDLLVVAVLPLQRDEFCCQRCFMAFSGSTLLNVDVSPDMPVAG
jgi:hypothetical protein